MNESSIFKMTVMRFFVVGGATKSDEKGNQMKQGHMNDQI